MKKLLSVSSLFFLLAAMLACSSGNCRENQAAKAAANPQTPSSRDLATSSTPVGAQDHAKVFKYDGSLQCAMGKAISVEDMKAQIKGGFPVYSAVNKSDGLMHMQACGTPTGKANVYEIDRKNLDAVLKQGFKEWIWD